MKHALVFVTGLLAGCGQVEPMAAANNLISEPDEQRPSQLEKPQGNVETGRVSWLRNLDDAKKKAKAADKPILVLFQEIPS